MYCVYLLINEQGKPYIGFTADIEQRLESHNSGQSCYAQNHTWSLVYYETYLRKEDAIRRERRLKDDDRARYQLMERVKESIHGLK